ncbi:MAG: InlB B-repeat-containing protein, partial [Opitutales bacterium]
YGYSISFYDEDGQEIEGSLRKAATISIPYDNTLVRGDNLSISYYSSSKDAWEQTYVSNVDEATGRIYANVEHFSLWAPTSPPDETPSGATDLTFSAESAGLDNWFQLPWFGYFFDAGGDVGWVYHHVHGWIFPKLAADGSLWFYDAGSKDWLWTSSTVYADGQTHFLYSHAEQAWTYHASDTGAPRWFYYYSSGQWRQEGKVGVTVEPSIGGSVSGAESYDRGATATLVATPREGYLFVGWSGDASGASTTISLTMDTEKKVVATFEEAPPPTVEEIIDLLFR